MEIRGIRYWGNVLQSPPGGAGGEGGSAVQVMFYGPSLGMVDSGIRPKMAGGVKKVFLYESISVLWYQSSRFVLPGATYGGPAVAFRALHHRCGRAIAII
jgi:hypothetical protein